MATTNTTPPTPTDDIARRNRIIELRDQGLSWEAIGKQVGVIKQQAQKIYERAASRDVRAELATLGVKRKKLIAQEEEVRAQLRELAVEAIRSGAVSQSAAAQAAGVDRMVVREWLGIRRRTAND